MYKLECEYGLGSSFFVLSDTIARAKKDIVLIIDKSVAN